MCNSRKEKSKMTDNYDVVVIGGGLSGFAAATEAAEQ